MKETKRKFYLVSEIESLKKKQKTINQVLIGTLIFLIVLLLSGCKQTEYVYVKLPPEPITCIDNIKTPLDMAKCLKEYKVKYD